MKEDRRSLKKLIYFDENSATDLIYVHNEGRVEEIFKEMEGKGDKGLLEVDTEVGIGTTIFSLLKAKLSGGAKLSYDEHSENLLSQVVTNTVLTDYLKISSEDLAIEKFSEIKVYPYPNSLTFYKLITPYMVMTEGKLEIDAEFSINIAMMDNALEKGKGYYEMIMEDNSEKVVLRFNLNSFRNNYLLADLVKMKLTFHAIEVGEIKENMINIDKEFSLEDTQISGFDLEDDKVEDKNNNLKVYDVIMAGVFK